MLLFLVGLAADGFAQSIPPNRIVVTSATAVPELPVIAEPKRAFPALNLGGGLNLAYVGMFTPDALFRTPSKAAGRRGPSLEEMILPAAPIEPQRRGDVPARMLISTERVVERLEPPAHAMAARRANTRLGATRNRFLTFAYGHPSVLYAAQHVVTDSQQRLIISDPAGNALHVVSIARARHRFASFAAKTAA